MLKMRGFRVTIYEKRIDPRQTKIPEGKSINLALSYRGIEPVTYVQEILLTYENYKEFEDKGLM